MGKHKLKQKHNSEPRDISTCMDNPFRQNYCCGALRKIKWMENKQAWDNDSQNRACQ